MLQKVTMQEKAIQDGQSTNAYRNYVLIVLTAIYAFNFLDRQMLVILQESIKSDLRLSDTQLGMLSGFAFAMMYVSAGIPIAYLADRRNRTNIVSLSLCAWSGFTALSGMAQNFIHLLMARVGVALGEAGGSPPSHSILSDYFPVKHRAKALGIYTMGVNLGVFLGYLCGGMLAEKIGWRGTFIVVGIPGIFLALLLKTTIKEPSRGDAAQSSSPTLSQTIGILKQRPSFWFLGFGAGFLSFTYYGVGNFLPSFLIRSHSMDVAEAGAVLSVVVGISGAVGTLLGGVVADRLGHRDKRWYFGVCLCSSLLTIPMLMLAIVSSNATLALVFVSAGTLFGASYLGVMFAAGHFLVPSRMRATVSALLLFMSSVIGLGFGPLFAGFISDLTAASRGGESLRHGLLLTSAVGILSSVFFSLALIKSGKDMERQQQSGEC
ncbi:MFS transporter [Halioxenophilus sp. WMMB6]|uniref:spinster family MFS transporter n=1 Tax=Halioxenophilus sp. WMMB6 TaxID=3073815 RepID=UPI00295E3D13|nr:MFS transporter [Halioxenophilus sp. WMMB6]